MIKIFKKLIKGFKILILLATLVLATDSFKLLENKATNINLNKTLDLAAMSKIVTNINIEEENIVDSTNNNILNTLDGQLTGYVYNCPLCSGRLACMSSLDLSQGNIHYEDLEYGTVRIVASSKNVPCGSIVRFSTPSISEQPIIAIVLDRGVGGTTIDLLVESESYAYNAIGRRNITYDILRNGWEG